ncbi:MAG TPA: chemotaxis protein CheW [Nitrospirota bacterium]|nr:chemotaxis protein CheW [Nitrospirota bacterium]
MKVRTVIKSKEKGLIEDTMQIVTFHVGNEEYGLEIKFITEVIRPLKITLLPHMQKFIEGVINLRGAIIPVVDLRKRFYLEAEIHNTKALRLMIIRGAIHSVSGGGNELLGLLVDSVKEVLDIPFSNIEPAPVAATGLKAELISGVGKVNERLIILLDVSKILSRQERSALTGVENV